MNLHAHARGPPPSLWQALQLAAYMHSLFVVVILRSVEQYDPYGRPRLDAPHIMLVSLTSAACSICVGWTYGDTKCSATHPGLWLQSMPVADT